MRYQLPLLLVAACLFLAACQATPTVQSTPTLSRDVSSQVIQRIDLAPDLYLRQIGEGVYVITHVFPWEANSLLVEMPDGTLVLAGTPYTPQATKSVLEWAQGKFGERSIVAIDTGYHVDNLGGNAILSKAGVPIYGSDRTVELLQERGETARQNTLKMIGDPNDPTYAVHASLKFVPPNHVFPLQEGLTLTFGGEEVQVIFPGPSQAPDKVAVYFPGRKLLFGSCMVLGGDSLGNTADADLQAWPAAIQVLLKLPVEVVIPGHGQRLDPELLQHTLDLLKK